MLHLSTREKNIFILCAAVTSVYLGYLMIFSPLKENNSKLNDQVESYKRQLIKSNRIIQKGKNYQARYDSYMVRFKQKVSSDEIMSSILSEIEQEAGKFNIRVTELKPQKVQKQDFYNSFPVSVTLEGNMREVIKLLYALQGEPHLFKVEQARFDQHYQKPATVQCQFIFSKIYFL